VFVRAKIIVNENHFQFDRKSFFNFGKTIYGFSEIKLFVLTRMFDIRLSEFSNCRSSESNRRRRPTTSGRRYPAGPRIWQESGRLLPDLAKTAGYDRIRPLIGLDLEDSNRIWLDPAIDPAGSGQTFSPESDNGDWTLPDSGGICQTLISEFCNFFVRAKHRKIFSRKSFFLKMISSKLFYEGNHFTSKQTEHKWKMFLFTK
jgi:hypothetical protein